MSSGRLETALVWKSPRRGRQINSETCLTSFGLPVPTPGAVGVFGVTEMVTTLPACPSAAEAAPADGFPKGSGGGRGELER